MVKSVNSASEHDVAATSMPILLPRHNIGLTVSNTRGLINRMLINSMIKHVKLHPIGGYC